MSADIKAPYALVIHGGAWDIPPQEHQPHLEGISRALDAGVAILQRAGTALEAVLAATKVLEDDPAFDAGTGSHLNREGRCELDALIMTGEGLEVGSVAALHRVRNPIEAALAVMRRSSHSMLVGEGAERFFREQGGTLVDPEELVVPRERERHRRRETSASSGGSTVGAVARDATGHVASASSTGGTLNKAPGRLGDTPLVGCGGYADDRAGAAASTGQGEAIMRVVMAKSVVDYMSRGASAQAAADHAISNLAERTGGRGGCIVVGRAGDVGWAHSTPHMPMGACWGDGCRVVRLAT